MRTFDISEDDKVLVIGSDGLWEFITNEEVMQIVSELYEIEEA